MHRRTKWLAAGAAAVVVLGGLAGLASAGRGGGWDGMHGMWGEGHGHRHGMMSSEMMARYDADKDGLLTQDEIDRNRTQSLSEFDADKTATLSLDEVRALWLKTRGEMIVREFQSFDRDGNGQVTLDEYRLPMQDLVASRDRNGDGAWGPDDRRQRGKHAEGHHRGHVKDGEQPEKAAPQPPASATP